MTTKPMSLYQARYTDNVIEDNIEICSDGRTMRFTLRGVVFEGVDFEDFTGVFNECNLNDENHSALVTLDHCQLEVSFPITIASIDSDSSAAIKALVVINTHQGSSVALQLRLADASAVFSNEKAYAFFEDGLIDIQNKLPSEQKIKTCLSCKFSNYHPLGNGLFAGLHCFRNVKSQVARVKSIQFKKNTVLLG